MTILEKSRDERKILLNNLPRRNNENIIDWEGSIGSRVIMIYEGCFYELDIVGYRRDNRKSHIDVMYKEKLFTVNTNYFKENGIACHLGKIAFTNPKLHSWMEDGNDGYIYATNSNKRINWICPECGEKVKNKIIQSVNKYGLCCPNCSDGVSYPEKVMYNTLKQIEIEFCCQKSFKWSNGKRYDFYIPELKLLIETHGIQHYEENSRFDSRTLKEEQENDILKKKMAVSNGYKCIDINCKHSDFEFIKNNILNSKLIDLLDFQKVDWVQVSNDSLKSIFKLVCDLHNKNLDVNEIIDATKLGRTTIINYLHRGTKLNLCNYDAKKVHRDGSSKGGKTRSKPVIQLTLNGEYIAEFDSATDAAKKLGIGSVHISSVCKNKRKSCGGYKWEYKGLKIS